MVNLTVGQSRSHSELFTLFPVCWVEQTGMSEKGGLGLWTRSVERKYRDNRAWQVRITQPEPWLRQEK